MEDCFECKKGIVSYSFSKNAKDFNGANEACSEDGEGLVKNIDSETYKLLNNCCKKVSPETSFWIGLNTDNHDCPQNRKYTWIHESECVNGKPLEIRNPQLGPQCHAVTITIQNKNAIPFATEFHCNNVHKFICQKLNQSQEKLLSYSIATRKEYVTSHVNATFVSTSGYKPPRTDVHQEHNLSSNAAAVVVGLISGSLLLLLLMVLFYYRYNIKAKKSNINFAFFKANMFRSQKTVATISTDKEIKFNSIYNK